MPTISQVGDPPSRIGAITPVRSSLIRRVEVPGPRYAASIRLALAFCTVMGESYWSS